MNYEFKKTLTDTPKEKPDPKSLGFGKIFTDLILNLILN